MAQGADAFETRLELFATVTLLGITAVMRTLQARDPGAAAPEALEKLRAVRDEVRNALASVDAYLAAEPEPKLDLSGLRKKLAAFVSALDEWPVGDAGRPA